MKSLTKREKTIISRSDISASLILNIFEPDADIPAQKNYRRFGEILFTVKSTSEAKGLFTRIKWLMESGKINIIGSEINN